MQEPYSIDLLKTKTYETVVSKNLTNEPLSGLVIDLYTPKTVEAKELKNYKYFMGFSTTFKSQARQFSLDPTASFVDGVPMFWARISLGVTKSTFYDFFTEHGMNFIFSEAVRKEISVQYNFFLQAHWKEVTTDILDKLKTPIGYDSEEKKQMIKQSILIPAKLKVIFLPKTTSFEEADQILNNPTLETTYDKISPIILLGYSKHFLVSLIEIAKRQENQALWSFLFSYPTFLKQFEKVANPGETVQNVVDMLTTYEGNDIDHKLRHAVSAGNLAHVIRLHRICYANIDAKEPVTGETAIHIACKNAGASDELVYLIQQYLIQQSADINITDKKGKSPLHLACETKQEALVHLLLENGADHNLEDEQGLTPFDYGCEDLKPQGYRM